MASTIATLATEVNTRLNLTNAGAEPSVAQISDFLRLSFKDLIGTLPPVQHTTLTLGNTYSAALVHDILYFLSRKGLPLFPWEYSTSGATVVVQPTAAKRQDALQAWYHAAPTITTGTTTTVETSCIFGDDWLEELAVIGAMMQTCLRLQGLAASNAPQDYGALYRVLGEQRDRLFAAHKATWDQWFAQMQMALQARAANGPDPVSYSGHVNFHNASEKTNWLTRAGQGTP